MKGRQQETGRREERGGTGLGIIFQLLPAALSRAGCRSWLRAPAPARRLSSPSPPSASPAGVKAPAVSPTLLTLPVASPFPARTFVKPLHKPSSNCPQRGMLLFPAGTLTVADFHFLGMECASLHPRCHFRAQPHMALRGPCRRSLTQHRMTEAQRGTKRTRWLAFEPTPVRLLS